MKRADVNSDEHRQLTFTALKSDRRGVLEKQSTFIRIKRQCTSDCG